MIAVSSAILITNLDQCAAVQGVAIGVEGVRHADRADLGQTIGVIIVMVCPVATVSI